MTTAKTPAMIKIFDHDLRNHQYSIEQLEENIDNLTNKTLLYTQKLTADFCVKYILNDEYTSCVEETYINVYDVLQAQPHITKEELSEALTKFKAINDDDDDDDYDNK
jgi:hypothetical protein